ncbi:hypothetical protein Belba_1481 [Belliella baltica DSM 15883]|uniref:Uncharacterized protein n=1 Tax=Belliella baltica (strain DSM 15883 / CIP 108006 / LMG 21964 / BA134) TaxID=866536 RepID=I3Z4C7_BELBD|nr:hypothetical protein [Belliella baltica]AFL84095.1 hypothetical protein Belba_1481 [Belliella baltica DSM 15883]
MKNHLSPVYWVTSILIIYITAIFANINLALILLVFSLSPLFIIWMVYKVLNADIEVNSTFEEKWYEDRGN